jgi:hypothetical protein
MTMELREFGPVELVAFAFENNRIPEDVVAAISNVPSAIATLLDAAIVVHDDAGVPQVFEYEAARALHDIPELELEAIGIAAEEDALELAADLPPGSAALVVAFEHTWLRGVTAALDASGGSLLSEVRIPAAVMNEIATVAIIEEMETES